MSRFKTLRNVALTLGIVLGGMLGLAVGPGSGQETAKPLVRELKGIAGASGGKGIADETELKRVFEKSIWAIVLKEVDFTKEQIVGFSWRGSGSESLRFEVKKDKGKISVLVSIHCPKQATTDLRLHRVWVVMPKGAHWVFPAHSLDLLENPPRTGPLLPCPGDLVRRPGGTSDFLTESGKLKEKLRLEIVSHVDRSGRVWRSTHCVIDESGEWIQTSSDLNFGIRPPFVRVVAQGKLSPTQLAALVQHLATQDFQHLPARFGIDAKCNGPYHSTTIRFGKKSTTFESAKASLSEGPGQDRENAASWSRFVALTLVVQNLCAESKFDVKVREIPIAKSGTGYPSDVAKPLLFTSAEELARALPDLARVVRQIDFGREKVLLFAWRGSGQDKLSFRVELGKAEPAVGFTYHPGRTEDLRCHAHLYVLPRNSSWRFER